MSYQSSISRNPGVRTGLHMIKPQPELDAYKVGMTHAETFKNADQSFDLDRAYQFMLEYTKDGANSSFSCSRERFQELATEAGEIKADKIRETFTALKLESMGVFTKCYRDPLVTDSSKKGCDFIIENGPHGVTHLEIKGPVDSLIRFKQGLSTAISKQSKDIGRKCQKQSQKWASEDWRVEKQVVMTPPSSPDKVLIVVDLLDVSYEEQEPMKKGIKGSIENEASNKSQTPHKHLMFLNKKDPKN